MSSRLARLPDRRSVWGVALSPLTSALLILAGSPVQADLAWTVVPAPGYGGGSADRPEPMPEPAGSFEPTLALQTRPFVATDVPQPITPPLHRAQAPAPAPVAEPPTSATGQRLREQLRIPPLVKRQKPWPSPSLSPGVPSAFVANWGDVYVGASVASRQNGGGGDPVDGSWLAGVGLGDAARFVAVELSGGCGSIKRFCGNGAFDVKVSRLLINSPASRLAISAAWQNVVQWGYEGPQDNIFYGAATYALPLRRGSSSFGQTLQFTAGVGNSRFAPATEGNSENRWGGFAAVGIELAPNLGVSAGWSGRGANAQLSYTPFRSVPISVNLLGADLFSQTPTGTVGVLSLSWGANFRTASFEN